MSQSNINATKLAAFEFLLPSVEEQQEIVRRVKGLLQLRVSTLAKVALANSRVDALTGSILAKAFRGELVPQDPNDEPASELLARIKRRKAESAPPKDKAKSPRRSRSRTTV